MTDKKKILPSEASYDELLKILEQKEELEEIEKEDITKYSDADNKAKVVAFLVDYGLKPGDHPISSKLLYELYKSLTLEPLRKQQFMLIIHDYLPITRYEERSQVFYLINLDSFKVSESILELKSKKRKPRDKSITYRKNFEQFLEDCKIDCGQRWLAGYIIHYRYLEHMKKKDKRSQFSYHNFIQMLKLYFEHKVPSRTYALHFGVDDATFDYYTRRQQRGIEARRLEKRKKKDSKKKKRVGKRSTSVPES